MSATSHKELGNAKYKEGKYAEAIEAYGAAIEADPKEVTYYGNRAAALLMLKKYDEALADCQQATQVDPNFVKGYLRGSKCHVQRGMLSEAKNFLNDCLKNNEGCAEAVKEMEFVDAVDKDMKTAQEHLDKGDYDRAGYYVDRVVATCPDSTHVMMMRAELLIGRNKVDDAGTVLWAMLAKDRQNPDLLYLRGKALLYGGSTDQAMKHFQEALRNDPDHKRARECHKMVKAMEKAKTAGNDAFKEGKCDEAISLYSEALAMDEKNVTYNSTIYCNRAAAKMRKKDFEGALEDCVQALKLNPGYTKALTRRAECYVQMKEFEKAIADYEEAIQREPDNRDFNQRLKAAKLEKKKAARKNYYSILEVSENADEADIKKAYKKTALKWHPDKWASGSEEEKDKAEQAFKDIGEAYAVLSDPMKRQKYDAGQDLEEIEQGGGFGGGDMDPNQLFQMFMSHQGGFGGMNGGGMGGMGGPGGMHFNFRH